jgi:hypothetical protein
VDLGIFDAEAPKVSALPQWRNGSLKDRLDAVIAHEYTEVTAPAGCDFPVYSMENAENTELEIRERAREILRMYRTAEGF